MSVVAARASCIIVISRAARPCPVVTPPREDDDAGIYREIATLTHGRIVRE